METKIIKLLKEKGSLNITELHTFIPEIKGDYVIYMPTHEGLNKNIFWLCDVSNDFIKIFNRLLIEKQLINWKPINLMTWIIDGSPIYTNVKTFEKKYIKKQTECWMPIAIYLKTKIEND
jgi:hypothetical protein